MERPILSKGDRNAYYLQMQREQGYLPEEKVIVEEAVDTKKGFLIIAEGENTEKYYFESFPVVSKTVIVLGGFPGRKSDLVEKAKKHASKDRHSGCEVWCVFDYDIEHNNPHQQNDFDNAIQEAINNDFKVAFSNDCFELWLILHDHFINNQHHRLEYYDKLTLLWNDHLNGKHYNAVGKSVDGCKNIYERLLNKQPEAIRNAKRLHDAVRHLPYHQMNPCTTVYKLVEELNRYI